MNVIIRLLFITTFCAINLTIKSENVIEENDHKAPRIDAPSAINSTEASSSDFNPHPTFLNVIVLDTLKTKSLNVIHDVTIGGNLTVDGTINGTGNFGGIVQGPSTSTINAVALYANTTGSLLKNSTVLVDSSGNVELQGITKNGTTLSWPTAGGAAGTFMATDGSGNLIFATAAGGGNVSTSAPFTIDNALIRVDLPGGAMTIKESNVVLDNANNITGVNQLTANTVNANLNGNATSANTAINFTGSLAGDVIGTQGATQVVTVGGQSAGSIASGAVLANAATNINTPDTIVKRDGSGNFNAGTITANLTGNVSGNLSGNAATATFATTAGSSGSFSGALAGDVTGNQNTTHVALVGGQTAANVANATVLANAATNNDTANTIVLRDSSGNFSAGTITSALIGNVTGNLTGNADTATFATTAGSAGSFSGSLAGDVTGTEGATVVAFVGGQSAANVASGAVAANAATNANTPNTIVLRDGSGNFSASIITSNLTGDVTGNLFGNANTATNATSAINFSGSLVGDVIGTQGATQVFTIGGQSATNVAAGAVLANAATNSNTGGAIVRRDGSGNFSAGTITADLTGNVLGNVTGNLTGNADTATLATTAGTATNFTGTLNGDVSGNQYSTLVNTVGGQSSTNIANAVSTVATATSNNVANTLVLRDSLGNFTTNMITIAGTITNPTDVVTKNYVDSAISTGLVAKAPAVVVSTADVPISGLQTIDGVLLVANDRVLLVGETNPIQNGLWLAQSGAWIRPTDFVTGTSAGQAYVLTTSGTVNAGSSWLCSTPSAIIDTDPIAFELFSLPNQTTGANVGTGVGQLFRDKTGVTLNFKTLAQSNHIVLTNNANEVIISTDATDADTPNTIVSRDSSGNFSAGTITANLTGAASLNVLKAGDTMTGNLNLAAQSELRFQDAAGGEYVGLRASAIVGTSYTTDLPTTAPTSGQFLQASSPTALQWAAVGGIPSVNKTYYVSLNGSDSNDGSFSSPFRTVSHAVSVANTVASSLNPIVIKIGAGIFVEDNSGGPISITADSISIIGSSITGTIIVPSTLSNHLFSATISNIFFGQLTMDAGAVGSTADAVNLVAGVGQGGFQSLIISRFNTGLSFNGSSSIPSIAVSEILPLGNGTAISINNARIIIEDCVFFGPASGTTPANTAIALTGTNSLVTVLGNSFRSLTTGVSATGGSQVRILGANFETTTDGIICDGASTTEVVGTNFSVNNSNSINITGSGVNTAVNITGCNFDGKDAAGNSQGIGVRVINNAIIQLDSSTILNTATALQIGTPSDTSSTIMRCGSTVIRNSFIDTLQNGLASLFFVGGVFESNKLSISNPTNVTFSAYDRTADESLAFGDNIEADQFIYQILNGQTNKPNLSYKTNYYGNKGTVYQNPNNDATFNATQAASNNASYYVLTSDRTKASALHLISDTSNVGSGDNVRGWSITKTGTSADLAFTYSNNDTSGQAARGSNNVILLNGFDNQVEFPLATDTPLPTNTVAKLVWAGDTNLYRSAASTLKTDSNFIVATLSPNALVGTDANSQLVSSAVTTTELSYLIGVTSPIQTQLDNKVNKSGDTMTGDLTLVAGSIASPSLNFTGQTTTGLSANTNNLSFSTTGSERLKISSTGTVSINNLTPAGVVHNDASGNLSSSLIVNADVDPAAAIVDTKLATISTAGKVANSATTATSANTANAIVARDASGNFSAGTITANLTGAASLNVLRAGDTMTGNLTLPTGNVASPSLNFTGQTTTGLSANGNNLSLSTNGNERLNVSSTGVVSINDLTTAGVVHNDASGNLTTSLIVNADVDPAAAIVDTKLATISTAGKVENSATTATSANAASTIVLRDASGNFNAGTISATLNGAASLNVLKSGDVMTGALTLPAGTAAAPSLNFTGGTTTGISAATANQLSFDTNGTERLALSTTFSTFVPFIRTDIFCDQAIQRITPVNNGSVTVNSTTSILLFKNTTNVNNFTVNFPPNPTNGQMFTILLGTTNSVAINSVGTSGASVVNPINTLSTGAPSGNAGGTAVTYFFSAIDNTWYRCGRG